MVLARRVEKSQNHEEFRYLIATIKACAKRKDLDGGIDLHADILKKGLLLKHPSLGSSLINLYAKCKFLAKAQEVLAELPVQDVVSWSALIEGYAQEGNLYNALSSFHRMQAEGFDPNAITFTSLLKACGITGAVRRGKQIHLEILEGGLLGRDIILGSVLVGMYVKFGLLADAHQVFEDLPVRNVVSWSTLIAGYVQEKKVHQAFNCLYQMQKEGISPNAVTFISILGLCGEEGIVEEGRKIHEEIFSVGLLQKHSRLGNALVDMYSKFGVLEKALEVHKALHVRDIISWNSLIAGYAQNRQCDKAMDCLQEMQSEGISPDAATFTCILKACASTGHIDQGNQIYEQIMDKRYLAADDVLGNALLSMFARCGALRTALEVFEGLSKQDVVSWNALIGGYVHHDQCLEAIHCFEQMQTMGILPNTVTFIGILQACSRKGAIEKGDQILNVIVSRGLLGDVVLGTALVDLYVKCGAVAKAQELLEELPVRNVVSWSALMAGYAQQGQGYKALSCLERMQSEGLCPNEVAFACVLNACSQSGLFDEAQKLFERMTNRYGIVPKLEHYIGMMMAFGFAGNFEKMLSISRVMPSNYLNAWLAILNVSRKWGNLVVGTFAFDQALQFHVVE